MDPLLVDLIVRLAPYGTAIILALIGVLEDLVTNQKQDVPTLAAVSGAIITGIDLAHPGWSDEERARCAKDAIAFYAEKLKTG